jgi:hypothetical protein
LVFQLTRAAERSWRKLGGFKLLPDVVRGIQFKDGIAVADRTDEVEDDQQKIAA